MTDVNEILTMLPIIFLLVSCFLLGKYVGEQTILHKYKRKVDEMADEVKKIQEGKRIAELNVIATNKATAGVVNDVHSLGQLHGHVELANKYNEELKKLEEFIINEADIDTTTGELYVPDEHQASIEVISIITKFGNGIKAASQEKITELKKKFKITDINDKLNNG